MIKKNTEKKTEKKTAKFKGMFSKKLKNSAAVDLTVDILLPPLGAYRHFKQKWVAAKTVELAEQTVDTVLENVSIEDLVKLDTLVNSSNEETEENEEKEEEEA